MVRAIPKRSSSHISIRTYKPVVPGRAGGGSFRRKRTIKAKKEFAYRMCARRRTSAMPKPSFLCAPAFSRSMVVMCRGGDVTCFDVMRLVVCEVTWGEVMWLVATCHVM